MRGASVCKRQRYRSEGPPSSASELRALAPQADFAAAAAAGGSRDPPFPVAFAAAPAAASLDGRSGKTGALRSTSTTLNLRRREWVSAGGE